MFEIEGAIVFGSWSRGGEWSDLDLLLVSDQVKHIKMLDRFKVTSFLILSRTDVFIYTYEEVESILNRMNPSIISALAEGITIRSRERIRKLTEYARERFTRKARLWITRH